MTAAYDPRAGRYVGGPAFGLAPPPLPSTTDAELELLVRFEHPAKFLAVKELPGAALLADECLAAAYGTTAGELARVREKVQCEVRDAARTLLAEPGLFDAVAAFQPGTFVALGDSITDDLQSWAEILRCCLDLSRPGEVTVINAGISGDTTADALARLYGIAAVRPDLVIVMLGTNDCQRHGPERAQLISAADSVRNAVVISRWLERGGARVVWLTLPPVDREALSGSVGDRPFEIRPADVLQLSGSLRASGLEVLAVGSRLAASGHLLADGVHPSLDGQVVIARAVVEALGRGSSPESG